MNEINEKTKQIAQNHLNDLQQRVLTLTKSTLEIMVRNINDQIGQSMANLISDLVEALKQPVEPE